ncbi:transcription factor BIM2-like isoform X3 [Tasmannia lanceolata]|uniref:transcription factor BIM2-like isoform X3 n=1 Tax=Tasmannia lanceolata TaxID=3420 RepID=UPI004062F20B
MELPQPRPFGTEGKKPTHDFLSLYSDSSFQHQDPRPPSQGFHLKTHDYFLNPLERVGKSNATGESTNETSNVEKPSVEHTLPGGIGTYSISHIPSFKRGIVKAEKSGCTLVRANSIERKVETTKNNSNSNSSSYRGGPFTLWEESSAKEAGIVKDKVGERQLPRGDLEVKVDGRGDQRAITPRSKHSATEQRRRSKINDRFQILRELIPHSDQKRDKASFLLEVIEYIQCLQEKVHKYEAAFPGWNLDSMKLMPWQKHNQGTGESLTDHSRAMKNGPGHGLIFSGNFDNNNNAVSPTMHANMQNPVESDLSTGVPYTSMDHHPGLASKVASIPLHQNTYPCSVGGSSGPGQSLQRLMPDAENMACQPHSHLWQRQCLAESDMRIEQEELAIEGGTVRMSSVYSQQLLSSLTDALQSSGIDLSQASISVQIELGKRAVSGRPSTMTSSAKDHEDPSSSNRVMVHSRVASSGEDSDHVHKRFKIDNS